MAKGLAPVARACALLAGLVPGQLLAAPLPPRWQPMPTAPASTPVVWTPVPSEGSAAAAKGPLWQPVLPGEDSTAPSPSISGVAWQPIAPDDQAPKDQAPRAPSAPTNFQEATALLESLMPTAEAYGTLLRLGQMPTATLPAEGGDQVSFQQVGPGSGGEAGGSDNQNYGFRADVVINRDFLVSAYYTYADDPLFAPITVRPSQPANLWTVAGASLRVRLAQFGRWTLAGEGALELFKVGSGCGGTVSCDSSGSPNIFNNSGVPVVTNNLVGSLSLPLSWQASRQLQLSLVPGVSFLPASQGAGQGGAGTFYGTNVSLGLGANYRLGNQVQLFGSAILPFGPGTNAFDGQLQFSRVPILTLGANVAVNPRIGLEASITNGFGLSPATAILALPSAPNQPLLSARFVWTPAAPDSPKPRYTARQASLALGGLSVSTSLNPVSGTTQLWANGDSSGNLLGSVAYSVSNDFQFQLAGGIFENVEPRNSFVDTFLGNGDVNFRVGGKAMIYRPTRALPIWSGLRATVGRSGGAQGAGYFFLEQSNTWEANAKLAFSLNPKLAWSGTGVSWGVGLAANLQLAERFQLIPEVNVVGSDQGGQNGSNGTLALRWLATDEAALDIYASNAAGLLDLGQLLNTNQVRVGARVVLSF